MAIHRYDVVAVTGEYSDQDGNTKRRYAKCGAVFETEKGLNLKLEMIPIDFNGWFSLFEPDQQKPKTETARGSSPRQARSRAVDLDDKDIPF